MRRVTFVRVVERLPGVTSISFSRPVKWYLPCTAAVVIMADVFHLLGQHLEKDHDHRGVGCCGSIALLQREA